MQPQFQFQSFHFFGIQRLPRGHSPSELAQSLISLINADLTDLSTLTCVHALLLESDGYY